MSASRKPKQRRLVTGPNREDAIATQQDLLAFFDRAPLNGRFWASMALVVATGIFDFFDFFLVGFLVAVLGKEWHLTFGQSSIMLLSAGVGAIAGSLAFGTLADIWGRKWLTVAGILLCAGGAGSIAFVPDGGWIPFAVLRFVVGFGVGGAAAVGVPMIVEYTPTRYRTVITGATVIPVSLGVFAASFASAWLLPSIGWRGLAMLGFAPVLPAVLIAWIMPESVRWLLARGQTQKARKTLARMYAVPIENLPLPPSPAPKPANASFLEVLAEPRRFWLTIIVWFGASTATYGVILWGPTIIALLLGVAVKDAAHLFIYVSLVGMGGRILFAVLPQWLGRRRCGEIMGYGAALSLGAAGLFHDSVYDGVPLFILLIIAGALFFDGGFANIAPYSAEVFPVRLSARGVGLAQAANGVGKIAGPMCLALIAGTGNFITPQATAAAVTPAFLFLAVCSLAVGLACSFLGFETHGKPLSLTEAPLDEAAIAGVPAPDLSARQR